jgi:hypothetical protein
MLSAIFFATLPLICAAYQHRESLSESSSLSTFARAQLLRARGDTLYPPFSQMPPLSLTDINGTSINLPIANAPLVVIAYDSNDAWTESAWSSISGVRAFLDLSLTVLNTRYLFAVYNDSDVTKSINFMRGQLTTAMQVVPAWTSLESDLWFAHTTFASDAIETLGNDGWVMAILTNYTNAGIDSTHTTLLVVENGIILNSFPRLDAHIRSFPTVPLGTSFRIISSDEICHNDTLDKSHHLPCAVLIFCDLDYNMSDIVRTVQTAGGSLGVIILPEGLPLRVLTLDTTTVDDIESVLLPAMMQLRASDGELLAAHLLSNKNSGHRNLTIELSSNANAGGVAFTASSRGTLLEAGWLSGDLRYYAWAAQWLDFEARTSANATAGDGEDIVLVNIFNSTFMQGFPGARATVTIPAAGAGKIYTQLVLDAALGCVDPWENSCPPWDRQSWVTVCCSGNISDPACATSRYGFTELGRYITPFRRGLGRWLTNVSSLLPLLLDDQANNDNATCAFTFATDGELSNLSCATIRVFVGLVCVMKRVLHYV